MKFSYALVPVSGLITFSVVLTILTAQPFWLYGALLIGGVVFFKLSHNQTLAELYVERDVPRKYYHNENKIWVTLRLTNKGPGKFRGNIFDKIPKSAQIMDGTNNFLTFLNEGETQVVKYSFSLSSLGSFKIGPTRIYQHTFSESIDRVEELANYSEIVILPVPAKIGKSPFIAKYLKSFGGPFTTKLVGDGWDFSGIREYVPTDTMKRINWKATSKFHKLHSNEFQIDQSAKIIIAIDITQGNETLLEETSKTVMGLLDFFINNQCKTGLLVIGNISAYFPPTSNRKKLFQISHYLAHSRPSKIKDFHLFKLRLNAVLEKVGSMNEVLLFSPLSDKTLNEPILSTLSLMGRLTVFTPSYEELKPKEGENINLKIAKLLVNMKRESIENLVKKQGITIIKWNPLIGLERSLSSRDRNIRIMERLPWVK